MRPAAALQLVTVQPAWEAAADGEGSASEPDTRPSTRGQNNLRVPEPSGCCWFQAGAGGQAKSRDSGLREPDVHSSAVKHCNVYSFQVVVTEEGREVQHVRGPK